MTEAGPTPYEYDAWGDVIRYDELCLEYDAADRLIRIRTRTGAGCASPSGPPLEDSHVKVPRFRELGMTFRSVAHVPRAVMSGRGEGGDGEQPFQGALLWRPSWARSRPVETWDLSRKRRRASRGPRGPL